MSLVELYLKQKVSYNIWDPLVFVNFIRTNELLVIILVNVFQLLVHIKSTKIYVPNRKRVKNERKGCFLANVFCLLNALHHNNFNC